MPTYGYRCTACGTEFERFQKMSDPPVTDCDCGATGTVKKLIFPVGIQFKGSGFYVNDYTGANKEKPRKSEDDPIPAAKDAKTETKTEAKTESTGDSAKTESKSKSKPESPKTDSKPAAPTTP